MDNRYIDRFDMHIYVCAKIRARNRRVLAIVFEILWKILKVKFLANIASSWAGYSVTGTSKLYERNRIGIHLATKQVYRGEQDLHRVCASDLPIEIASAIMKVGQSVVSPVASNGKIWKEWKQSHLSEVTKALNGCRGLRAKKREKWLEYGKHILWWARLAFSSLWRKEGRLLRSIFHDKIK